MKAMTIKQAAIEYARTLSSAEVFIKKHVKDFEAGVNFAQEWISVEDELPPVGELVLTKTVINDEVFYSLDSIICMETDDETFYQYPSWTEGDSTHWRPIERE